MSAVLLAELERALEDIRHADIVSQVGIGFGGFPTLEESLMATEQMRFGAAASALVLLRQHGPALARMAEDAERLDWLARAGDVYISRLQDCSYDGMVSVGHDLGPNGYGHDLRAAIDASLARPEGGE